MRALREPNGATQSEKRTGNMSPSASPAREPEPDFIIRVREEGGILGTDRIVLIEGKTLRVVDRGQVRIVRVLPDSIVQRLLEQVRDLEKVNLRRNYGRNRYASDSMTTELEIRDEPRGGLEVKVISDPSDPPPEQFWQVVDNLETLTKGDFTSASGDF